MKIFAITVIVIAVIFFAVLLLGALADISNQLERIAEEIERDLR